MNSREKLINIYLIYKDLLTKKQQDYFKYYYFEDLSLSEISENMLVSKAFVGKTLKQIENKLNDLENTLKINTLYNKIKEISKKTTDKETKKELENLI